MSIITEPAKVWTEHDANGVQRLFSYDPQTRITSSWEIHNIHDGQGDNVHTEYEDESEPSEPFDVLSDLRTSLDAGEYIMDNTIVVNLLNGLWSEFDNLLEQEEQLDKFMPVVSKAEIDVEPKDGTQPEDRTKPEDVIEEENDMDEDGWETEDEDEPPAVYNPKYIELKQKANELLKKVLALMTLLPQQILEEEVKKCSLEYIPHQQLQQYMKSGKVSSSYAEQCLICIEEYKVEEELATMTCHHAFHRHCLDKWMQTGIIYCPVCRSKIINSPFPQEAFGSWYLNIDPLVSEEELEVEDDD